MAIIFEEDTFRRNARGIAMLMLKALLLLKTVQTKPQIEENYINYSDLYYTNISNLSDEWEKWVFMKIISRLSYLTDEEANAK